MRKASLRLIQLALATTLGMSMMTGVTSAATPKTTWHGFTAMGTKIGSINDVACTSDLCFAAEGSGGLLSSTDNTTWTRFATAPRAALDYIVCSTSNACTAVGSDLTVYSTSDDGATWTSSTGLKTATAKLKLATVSQFACVAGAGCIAYISYYKSAFVTAYVQYNATISNGTLGAWKSQTLPSGYLSDLTCGSSGCVEILLTSKSAAIVRYSSNVGSTWSTLTTGSRLAGVQDLAVSCSSTSSVCAMIGDTQSGFLANPVVVAYRSSDGGATWNSVTAPSISGSIDSVSVGCYGTASCYVDYSTFDSLTFQSSTGILLSSDGGATYSGTGAMPQGSTDSIRCVGTAGCYLIAGSSGSDDDSLFFSTDLSTWTAATIPWAVEAIDRLSCFSATQCDALTTPDYSKEQLIRSADGGQTWSVVSTLPDTVTYSGTSITGLYCDATNCVISGVKSSLSSSTAVILHSSDSGATWSSVTPSVTGYSSSSIYSLTCFLMHCVSVGSLTSSQGSEVAIYSSSDTGATWSRVSTSVTGALYSVSCVSATQCRAVGYSKTTKGITEVSMSTNNGTTWASTPMTGIGILISISCSTMNLCAIIGGDKNLNTFTSTLVSGVLQKTSSSPNIRSEVVCSPSRCSIASVTTKGVVFADSTNGGKSYSTVSTLSVATGQAKSPGLTLSCPSVSLCIAVSDDGFISRRY